MLNAPELCERIAGTIKKMDAHIIGIQEGPPLKSQMELFVDRYLDNKYKAFTSNSRWQTIHALVENFIAHKVSALDSNTNEVKALWKDIGFYPWGEIKEESKRAHSFYRRPLMLTYNNTNNKKLDILIIHTKSKYSSLDVEGWTECDEKAIFDALLARQKLSAEMYRLRKYTENHIENKNTNLMIIG